MTETKGDKTDKDRRIICSFCKNPFTDEEFFQMYCQRIDNEERLKGQTMKDGTFYTRGADFAIAAMLRKLKRKYGKKAIEEAWHMANDEDNPLSKYL